MEELDLDVFENLWALFQEQAENNPSLSIEQFAKNYPARERDIKRLFPLMSNLRTIASKSDKREEPKTVGNYAVIRQIGLGGMGVVYECSSDVLRERVAIKVIDSACLMASGTERFEREARIAGTLHHSNIVPIYDYGDLNGQPYYSMRFIDGPNLAEVLHTDWTECDTSNPRQQRAAELARSLANNWSLQLNFASQCASALDYAHQQGILHRDVKPANLLVDRDNKLWMTDFGLAKHVFDSKHLTLQSKVLGTPRYMAPEQIRGDADERSDVFALGLVLYEMAILRPDGKNSRTAIWKGGLQPPRDINPAIPKKLDAIIMRSVSADPESRYESMRHMIDEIDIASGNHPPSSIENKDAIGRINAALVFLSLTIVVVGLLIQSNLAAARSGSFTKTAPHAAQPLHVISLGEGEKQIKQIIPFPEETNTLSGPDASHFELTSDGQLAFVSTPDYEVPADHDLNNQYDFSVVSPSATSPIRIKIKDVNEPPEIPQHVFLPDGKTVAVSWQEAAEPLAIPLMDDADSAYSGLTVAVVGGKDDNRIGMTPPGVFIISPPLAPSGGSIAETLEFDISISDRSQVRFARLEEQNDDVVLRFEHVARGATIESDSPPLCKIRSDVIDIATANGKEFFHIHADGHNTCSLFRTIRSDDGSWSTKILSKNCGIEQDAIAFATANGREFLYLRRTLHAKSHRVQIVRLTKGGVFTRVRESDLARPKTVSLHGETSGFSWLDDSRMYFVQPHADGTSRFHFAFSQRDGSFTHMPLSDRHQYTTNVRGQAVWAERKNGSLTTTKQIRLQIQARDD